MYPPSAIARAVVAARLLASVGARTASLRVSARSPRGCRSSIDAPYGTNCPRTAWVDAMVIADAAPGKVIVDVGCNKGDSLMRWMERWDMSAFWSTEKWVRYYASRCVTHYACPWPSNSSTPLTTARQGKRTSQTRAAGSGKPLPLGVCVEPMPANVNLLRGAVAQLGYKPSETREQGALHIVQAAVLDVSNKTIGFPSGFAGQDDLGVHSTRVANVPVLVKTVDGIVAELDISRVDVLLVDTEGADPAVLRGAAGTLRSVRYLEFEVHRDLVGTEWEKTTLASVVHELDALNFECFWAGNNGKLLSMNACWADHFELGTWANAACVKRGDVWQKVLQRFTEQ